MVYLLGPPKLLPVVPVPLHSPSANLYGEGSIVPETRIEAFLRHGTDSGYRHRYQYRSRPIDQERSAYISTTSPRILCANLNALHYYNLGPALAQETVSLLW
jgi:hypothetical protein